ncbi:MAG: PKD domain-containing protein [Bacteroidota bacterium]|nr:PKD domain-containing protein [Bacteroidota bacterium]
MTTGSFLLQNDGYRVILYNQQDLSRRNEAAHGVHPAATVSQNGKAAVSHESLPLPAEETGPITLRGHAYAVRFLNANPHPVIIPDKAEATYSNYFIGNDATKWARNCKTYLGVTYQNVYPNIDVRYYTTNGVLKYDFIVHPGGDPSRIALYFDGVDGLKIKEGSLQVKTSVDDVVENQPYSYQLGENGRKEIPCSFDVKGNIVQFRLAGSYTPDQTLVIDPQLIFSTFTGSTADNWGYTATYDNAGNFYAGGIVFGIPVSGFPTNNGAFKQFYQGGSNSTGEQGGYDMGIIKFDPTGTNRIYATYLGGASGNEQPHSLVVDNSGNLIIAGRSTSSDYPVKGSLQTYSNGSLGGWDIVVTKLNAAGTDLIGSVRIGGTGDDGVNIRHKYPTRGAESIDRNYGDDARSEVIVDAANNIYFASCTQSKNFPTTSVSTQTTLGAANAAGRAQDAVILKLSPDLNSVLFSVLMGGSDDDAGFVLAINPLTNNLYVAGATASANFPGNKAGTKYPVYQGGGADGFIAEFTPDGNLIRDGFFGTTGIDIIYGIGFDKYGFPYISGTSTGDWPVINAAFSQTNGRQFIAKLKPDLSDFVYSTVFGTGNASPNISPTAFLVDRCENVYVSGWGGTTNSLEGFPNAGTRGLPITADAYQKTTDNSDFYFFVLEKDAKSQLYGSFFGQNGGFGEHVDGGTSRFDRNGVIYQSICANCGSQKPPFPTTPGVWSQFNRASDCNLAAIKIAFNLAGIGAGIQATINGIVRDTSGCVPLVADFTDTMAMGKQYIWDFNDGSPSVTTTVPTISHTFNTIGLYRVKLISVDSSSCNIADTAYIRMRVRNDEVALSFIATKLPPCASLAYEFDNTSQAIKPFQNNSFRWDFGDGTTQLAGGGKVTHTYAAGGTYNVKLILIDSNYCNEPDSLIKQIRISPNVKAQFTTPAVGCLPYNAVFTNTSQGGTDFIWDFGDGTTSTQTEPIHSYTIPGTYNVRLIASDTNTCNKSDTSALIPILVSDIPKASFSFSPDPTKPNTPVEFLNSSIGGTRFKWIFGDGDSLLINRSDSTVAHLYNASGTFNTCLVAFNNAGCSDTTCQDIPVTINSVLDVANAFSPNGDGQNDRIYVKGFGISQMTWTIYNRWGTVVYKSSNQNEGWDGTYNGKGQPQDVYHYTLVVEFSSKQRATKKGDITLLR